MTTGQTITRFAPSPTGKLHIGGARTALFNWAYAKRRHGRFLLRVEDTDQVRSSESATSAILDDLAWLGIGWQDGPEHVGFGGDERNVGPYFQAQRLEVYGRFFQQLLDDGHVYPAFDTPDELEAMRAEAAAAKRTFRYSRTEGYDHEAALERMREQEHVLRLRVPDDPIVVRDEILGDITFTSEHFDDFVIRKNDGYPTYHFAVVVDDELMGVTHVIRGQEHLNNTARHVALQKALGFTTPSYAHIPLISNPDGSKMSKRDKDKAARQACKDKNVETSPVPSIPSEQFERWLGDKKSQLEPDQVIALAGALGVHLPEIDVSDFRESGYLPEVVCNYVALLGWNPGDDIERFDNAFLGERFSFDRCGKSASKFDREKLRAFNGDTIAQMESGEFRERWREWMERYDPELLGAVEGSLVAAGEAVQPRIKTLREARDVLSFVLADDDGFAYDEKAVKKGLEKGEPSGVSVLRDARPFLDSLDYSAPDGIEPSIRAWCEERSLGMGKLAQPVRVALTGTQVSPPLGLTLALLGRERVLKRVDRCLSEFDSQ